VSPGIRTLLKRCLEKDRKKRVADISTALFALDERAMRPLDFQFLKDRYDFEVQRKDKLTDSLNLPVAIVGGLGILLGVMARSFTYTDQVLTWLFLVPLSAALFAFLTCLVHLARAYRRQKHMYLPLLSDLDESQEEFLEFAKVMAGSKTEILDEFEAQVHTRMIDAADRNTRNNDERSSILFMARVSLFAVLALTALTGVSYVADQVRFSMSKKDTPSRPVPSRPAPESTTPQPPQVPPNREIREGDAPARR
jgi:hypothetical protein